MTAKQTSGVAALARLMTKAARSGQVTNARARASKGASPDASLPDAFLIHLCATKHALEREWLRARKVYGDAGHRTAQGEPHRQTCLALSEAILQTVGKICETPAQTAEGLTTKANALASLLGGAARRVGARGLVAGSRHHRRLWREAPAC